jgi:hypothetical protein
MEKARFAFAMCWMAEGDKLASTQAQWIFHHKVQTACPTDPFQYTAIHQGSELHLHAPLHIHGFGLT